MTVYLEKIRDVWRRGSKFFVHLKVPYDSESLVSLIEEALCKGPLYKAWELSGRSGKISNTRSLGAGDSCDSTRNL